MTAGSTAIIHSGNQIHKDQLLALIGGKPTLHKAVDRFYERLIHDEQLHVFFAHANVAVLKWHQFNIISFAFTEIPEDFDVEDLILTRHESLFERGLCEYHFDVIMRHFEETLRELRVEEQVIEHAKQIIAPLRGVFVQGARNAQRRQSLLEQHRLRKATVALSVAFAVSAYVFLRRRK